MGGDSSGILGDGGDYSFPSVSFFASDGSILSTSVALERIPALARMVWVGAFATKCIAIVAHG